MGTIYTRNAYTLGKGELAWDTWPNHLVDRPSLQSGNETNDLLKSGPALTGPAGPVTPPLRINPAHAADQIMAFDADVSLGGFWWFLNNVADRLQLHTGFKSISVVL